MTSGSGAGPRPAGRAFVAESGGHARASGTDMEAVGRRRAASPPGAGGGKAASDPGGDALRIERLCAERGFKMTGQRRLIARVLSEARDHPDVEEVYRRALALDSKVSIATVYRTVRLFEERGILERHDFGGGRARYEPTEHGHHYHLVDVDTGQVVEFGSEDHERLVRAIAAGLGFELAGHRLELFGRRAPSTAASAGARPAADPRPRSEPTGGEPIGGDRDC